VNPSKWIVKVTFPDGAKRYWCGFYEGRPWQDVRAHASRYDTEMEAITQAYNLKGTNRRIVEVEAEELVNPRTRF
jgi:hypothetical protein